MSKRISPRLIFMFSGKKSKEPMGKHCTQNEVFQ